MTLSVPQLPGGFSSPPFRPLPQPPNTPSPLATPSEPWVEVLVSSCHFGLSAFLATLKELCLHPERNSGLILRGDQLTPKAMAEHDSGSRLGMEFVEEVRVRLIPKQPKRDSSLDQRCLFYGRERGHDEKEQGLVLYVPEINGPDEAPFYYPPVRKLAFLWETFEEPQEGVEGEESLVKGRISIAYLPWSLSPTASLSVRPIKQRRKRSPLAGPPLGEDTSEVVRPPAIVLSPEGAPMEEQKGDDRLLNICTSLLERLHKHGYGTMVGYRKRVLHDVGEEPVQH